LESQVAALLASCDRASATGRRDLAILTVLARLGLRAGEVAALTLEDIDWRRGELVVRGKGNRLARLPRAPYRALSSTGITTVVAVAGPPVAG